LDKFLAPREIAGFKETPLKVGEVKEMPVGESKLVYIDGEPVLVIHVKPERFTALSAVCTHLRCGVSWDKEMGQILCPCHGGAFDANGNVLRGPPPRPLARYSTEIKDGTLYIKGRLV